MGVYSEAMIEFRDAVRNRIAATIKDQGRTQRWVAEHSGMTARQLSARLRGESPLTVDDVALIASALGKEPTYFFYSNPPAQAGAA